MRDFAETLDDRLRSLADYAEPVSRLSVVPAPTDDLSAADHPPVSPPVRHGRQRVLRRPAFTGGMAAAIGAAATALVLGGSGPAGLPILETESSDASVLKASATLSAVGVDFSEGYRFSTPQGAGWVVASHDESTLCISLPDRDDRGAVAAACAPRGVVERRGLAIELVGDRSVDPAAMNKVALLLPTGAADVKLTTGGRTVSLQTEAGVAVAWLTGPGSFAFRLNGKLERRSFEGPFERSFYTCKGKRVDVTPTTLGPRPAIRC